MEKSNLSSKSYSSNQHQYSIQRNDEVKQQLQVYVKDWIKSLNHQKLPINFQQFQAAYLTYLKLYNQKDQNKMLYQQFQKINIKSIKQQFNTMWFVIFIEIQSHLQKCFKQGSLKLIYPIIQKNLYQNIFGKKYTLLVHQFYSQNTETSTGNQNQQQLYKSKLKVGLSLAFGSKVDTIFAQLFQIMFETLQKFIKYYKVNQKQDNLNDAVFQALACYIKQNQQSYFVKGDSQEQMKEQKQQKNLPQIGIFLYEALALIDGDANERQENSVLKKSKYGSVIRALKKVKENPQQIRTYAKETAYGLAGALYGYAKQVYNYTGSLKFSSKQKNQPLSIEDQKHLENLQQDHKDLTKSTIRIVKDHLKSNLGLRKKKISEKQLQFLKKFALNLQCEQISKIILQENKNIMIDAVTTQIDLDQCMFIDLKKEVIKELMNGLQLTTRDFEDSRIRKSELQQHKQISQEEQLQQWLLIMTLLYKAVQKNYDPYRRRMLKKIFKHFNKQNSLKIDSVGILKILENQSVKNHDIPQILKSVRNDSEVKRVFSHKMKQQLSSAQLNFEHQVNRIYLFQFKKKYQQQRIQFVRLSDPGKHNRVVNLLISGFLSEDTDKIDQWKQLMHQMPDSEVYSVCWASKTSQQIIQFAYNGMKDIAFADLGILGGIGGPYIRAIAIMRQIYKKYNENPFQPAFQTARLTGYYLAEIIISSFKGHIINLIGFSLGTQVLRCTLQRLNERNHLFMINKIVTMGGVADHASYPLDVTNMYSDRDMVLKYLFRISKPFSSPIGINKMTHCLKLQELQQNQKLQQKQVQNTAHKKSEIQKMKQSIQPQSHLIRNVDCSDFINGHTLFRKNMKVIGKIIDARQQ